MNDWISVKDRMPEEEGEYLCFRPKGLYGALEGMVAMFFIAGANFWETGEKEIMVERDGSLYRAKKLKGPIFSCDGITHWMPLPEPPDA